MAVIDPLADPYAPSAGHMLYIPAGLLMLFFGGFLVKPSLCVISCVIVSRFVYALITSVSSDPILAVAAVAIAAVITFMLVLEICEQGPDFATGAVLGVCIALTFYPAPMLSLIMAVVVLSAAFGLVFSLVPKEVGIFISSYGGAYMIFFGMELIDSDVFDGSSVIPEFVKSDNIDMWFSVLSFMVVGLLGCCVQLILVSGQAQPAYSRSHYIEIP
ncbi:hypothetical protein BWQ96_07112 [Gracilariopsis chorda]|uniref:TM7S3/TM198-like domain-containing protein n=1 Tax=Gracilariopsis chorda TaxID=448386 RepID=A0A2V3IM68_9FLOR|nr:hypothetical protein BWQ96_07112 [Gracilariopsis chorda]|eukprot:PXF43168.1 hypothetical protein BWQ96_07112 [Gracilariopsis chorda]